ncbi:MAG: ribonuclease III [Candidatus Tectimicrobiota bacterium]
MISAERLALLEMFQSRLGYTFRTIVLLDQALTHRSYVHEMPGTWEDYERLEFLGDAVLGLLISEEVYSRHPHASEGGLSQLRAGLVSQAALAEVARQLDLGQVLRLGRGEAQNGGQHKASILAAAFEALLAALYLDGGLSVTRQVVVTCFAHLRPQMSQLALPQDYKSLLQVRTLSAFGCLPTYRVIREEGPAHQKTFHVQLTLQHGYHCVGVGRSKKAAEQHAAQQLLEHLLHTEQASAADLAGR